MEFTNEGVATAEIVPSMKNVELLVDDGVYRAEYDNTRDQPSLAVVAAVAAADNSDPCELSPLHSAIDTGALDDLFSATANDDRGNGHLSFLYEGFGVTVSREGTIEVSPRGRNHSQN